MSGAGVLAATLPSDLTMLGRIGVAFGLAFAIGFERQLRGAPAGDRTYALIGTGAAAITAVTVGVSPQAIGGVVTGIGFVGAGLVFREPMGMVRNVTSAATIFVVAAVGIVSGTGHPLLAVAVAAIVLFDLELAYHPWMQRFERSRSKLRVEDDPPAALPVLDPPEPDERPH